MKTIALSLAGCALMLGLAFTEAEATRPPAVIEGKDRPILLGRMVVIATALPDEAR